MSRLLIFIILFVIFTIVPLLIYIFLLGNGKRHLTTIILASIVMASLAAWLLYNPIYEIIISIADI